MSETTSERQTGINKHGGQQVGSVKANSRGPGSRSLQAGGEFLKALASDVAAVASQLRLLLTAKRRRMRLSAPSRTSQGRPIGRMLWRLSIALFGFVLICAGALSAVMLWVLFGFPPEPQKSDADTLGSHFEARKGESLGGVGPLKATGAAWVDPGREPGAQSRPEAQVTSPSIASSGSSSPDAAEPKQATKERQTERGVGADQPQLARTEPQDRRPAAPEQNILTTLTDLRPRAQCSVDLCAARYASFHAADCTYQPHGGGPRRICELSTRSAEAAPQTSRAATDPRSEAKHTRVAERAEEVPKSATPARAGAQCNVDVCSARYASFHAVDCTYQPHGGGPRRICER
jgi:hypothetical protein